MTDRERSRLESGEMAVVGGRPVETRPEQRRTQLGWNTTRLERVTSFAGFPSCRIAIATIGTDRAEAIRCSHLCRPGPGG